MNRTLIQAQMNVNRQCPYSLTETHTHMNMASRISISAFLALVCAVSAMGDQSSIRESRVYGQCKDIVSTIRTDLLAKVKDITPEELPSLICDLDDTKLQAQCTEVLSDNGAELLDFLKVADEGELCEYICQEFELVDSEDFSLYFQPANGATRTDEVGGYICSICKRVMTFLHNFLTAKGHEGFVIHMLKGVCHFVPMFHTQCDLLINMYGRLLIRLAGRYLGPNLCKTFHLCRSQLPELTCGLPEDIQDGAKTFVDAARGSTVTYSCNEGFRMIQGEATRTCGEDGQWTGKLPSCIELIDME